MKRIYVASSWRNPYQPSLVRRLEAWGHMVYDFKRDRRKGDGEAGSAGPPRSTAFSWGEMDPKWTDWSPQLYRELLQSHERAASGYLGDHRGMEWADTCVLCLPCGNSAHIKAGYMKGRGKRLIIYWEYDATYVASNGAEVCDVCGAVQDITPDGHHNCKNPDGVKTWKFEPDLMYLLADNLCIGASELKNALR